MKKKDLETKPMTTDIRRIGRLAVVLLALMCGAGASAGVGGFAGAEALDRSTEGTVVFVQGALTPPQPGTPFEIAESFLRDRAFDFGLVGNGIVLEHVGTKTGIASHHVRYRQVVDGLEVVGGQVFVHMSDTGVVQTVQNRTFAVDALTSIDFSLDAAAAIARGSAHVDLRGDLRAPARTERVVTDVDGRLTAAWRVTLAAQEPLGDWCILVDAVNGTILDVHDHLHHATGFGRVFNPDPVRSSGNKHLKDRDDRDQQVLTAELINVDLENLDGSGYIRGTFADAHNSKGRAWSNVFQFGFIRGRDNFEEVMFYYHVDRLQAWFGEIGIHNANRRQQVADVHGTSADNSFYSPTTKRITFGSGGVDDAEDADIILHEYGHAMQDDQVEGWGQSHESSAMGEGFGDWLAATYFSGDEYGDANDAVVGDWDAMSYSQANPPALRRVDGNKIYPRDMDGSVHRDGEIWSRALWDLRWMVGREVSMRLVVESHFYCTPYSSFYEGAMAIVAADQAIYGGKYQFAIREAFLARGILSADDLPAPQDELRCRVGNVRTHRGEFEEAISVNGTTGNGDERVVLVDATSDVAITVTPPKAQAQARFAMYGWIGTPTASSVSPQPYEVGTMCFPTLLNGGNPDVIWNNANHVNKLGQADFESERAPYTMTHSPAELGLGSELTLQGFIENKLAGGSQAASITNAIVLRVE